MMLKLFVFACLLYWANLLKAQEARIGFMQQGRASYYADNRGGASTRSGETYEMTAMEGAHKTLPFGAVVRVVNLENQRQTLVRINDRPYSDERIMDFTKAVADSLGMKNTIVDIRLEVVYAAMSREEREALRYANPKKRVKTEQKPTQPPIETVKPKESEKPKETVKPKETIKPKEVPFGKEGIFDLNGKAAAISGYGVQICAFEQLEKTKKEALKVQKLKLAKIYIQISTKNGKLFYKAVAGQFAAETQAKALETKLKNKGITTFVKKY